jgi:hypothetical protein
MTRRNKMANINESAIWDEGVYQIEELDPVLGGPEGIDNKPLKNLANRTRYLKQIADEVISARGGETSLGGRLDNFIAGQADLPETVAGLVEEVNDLKGRIVDYDDLYNMVTKNAADIAQIKDAIFSDIVGNPFQVTFADLDGIELISGVWNNALHRIEC